MRKIHFSIQSKIIAITAGILLLSVGAVTILNFQDSSRAYKDLVGSHVQNLGRTLVSRLEQLLELEIPVNELTGFEEQCRELVRKHEQISMAMVVDPRGRILFHHNRSGSLSQEFLSRSLLTAGQKKPQTGIPGVKTDIVPVVLPVMDRGVKVAFVVVGFPMEIIQTHLRRSSLRTFLVASVFFAAALGLLLAGLSNWVTRPLKKLTGSIRNIQETEYALEKRVQVHARDEIGQLAGAFNTLLDTLQRTMVSKQALKESEDRNRDLVEFSGFFICTHDLQGRILSANPEVGRSLGYEVETLLGKNLRDFLTPEFEQEFDSYMKALERDEFAEGVMQVQTCTGEPRIWEYKNTLRTEGVAEPVVRGMAHDVTDRRRKEKERERLIQELQDSLQQVRTLKGLIPICANCKKIRDDQGYWNQLESYIHEHSEAEFSHGICPECSVNLYPDLMDEE